MNFWTIQKRTVFEFICEKGYYQPSFLESDFLKENDELEGLYGYILKSFGDLNGFNVPFELPGLVFCFMRMEDEIVRGIYDLEDFLEMIAHGYDAVESLWKRFLRRDCVLLKLEYKLNFNPVYIDINDFQYLMPPIIPFPQFPEEYVDNLLNNIRLGEISSPTMPTGIVQTHVPHIHRNNIVECYELKDVNELLIRKLFEMDKQIRW